MLTIVLFLGWVGDYLTTSEEIVQSNSMILSFTPILPDILLQPNPRRVCVSCVDEVLAHTYQSHFHFLISNKTDVGSDGLLPYTELATS